MIFDNDKMIGNIAAFVIAIIYCILVIDKQIPADGFGILAGMVIRHLIGLDTTNGKKEEVKPEQKDGVK